MIQRFINWLHGPTALTIARSEHMAAHRAYHTAVARGDTRKKHDKWPALYEATNNLLAAERRG
jgi:hypothetical protein